MSARDEIQWAVNFYASSDDESDRITDEIYQAARAEILREAAEKIRAEFSVDLDDDYDMGANHAADFIDPDKENEA